MKLNLPTWLSVILFLGIALIHFVAIASGWYNPLLHWFWPMIGAFSIAGAGALLCAAAAYDVIVARKAIKATKDAFNSPSSNDRKLATGYWKWNFCAVALFWIMLALQISEV